MKAFIALACFAFSPSERILSLSVWMQKDWEILTHWTKALGNHFFNTRTNNYIVDIVHGQTHEGVPYCAADCVDLHYFIPSKLRRLTPNTSLNAS